MHLFYRPQYRSDVTDFLKQLKADRPDLDAAQLKGRSLLWDKNVSREAWSGYREATVAQQTYVYQTDRDK